MSTKYADRAFISVNGARIADVQSSQLRQNHNRKNVPSMTNDGFDRGFVQGNRNIDVVLQIAVLNKLARPKLESIDYENSDVSITYLIGADQFICTGVFLKDNEDNASGVGSEVKTTFNFGALRVQDAVGNSVLFNISL